MNLECDKLLHGLLTQDEELALRNAAKIDPHLANELREIDRLRECIHAARQCEVPRSEDFVARTMRSINDLPKAIGADRADLTETSFIERILERAWVDKLMDLVGARQVAWAAGCAVLLVSNALGYLWGVSNSGPQYIEVAQVLMPKRDIAPGTPLSADLFRLELQPTSALPPRAVRSVDDLSGKIARDLILANYPLDIRYTQSKQPLQVKNAPAFLPINVTLDISKEDLSRLSPGAVLNLVVALAGEESTKVATLSPQAALVAIRKRSDDPSDPGAERVEATVVVSPEDAAKIRLAEEQGTVLMMNPPPHPSNI